MIVSLQRLFRKNKNDINLLVLNLFVLKFSKATDVLWKQMDSS